MKPNVQRIAVSNAASLLRQGEAAIRKGDAVFDLSAVERCDSSAVALLLAWKRLAVSRGLQPTFTGLPNGLQSLLVLYGVDRLIGQSQ